LKTFVQIIDINEPDKVDNTIDTIVSVRSRMTGFEKCPICQKMMKQAKDGEVYWLEKCNEFYHVECIREYIDEKIQKTEFPITCAN